MKETYGMEDLLNDQKYYQTILAKGIEVMADLRKFLTDICNVDVYGKDNDTFSFYLFGHEIKTLIQGTLTEGKIISRIIERDSNHKIKENSGREEVVSEFTEKGFTISNEEAFGKHVAAICQAIFKNKEGKDARSTVVLPYKEMSKTLAHVNKIGFGFGRVGATPGHTKG